MIIFKQLSWSNFFSYGDSNSINLVESPVTQLVGENGAGKSSIALIIQEILYGRNIKKIVKANLKNRNLAGAPEAELLFSVDNTEYKVHIKRGSKLVVTLHKDGEDISSHTAPATMKSIENILNIDFDTFSQLIYQSSKINLQFLTATDTQRKRFLIKLFNLEKYMEIFEQFKKKLLEVSKEVAEINGRYAVYQDWIDQHKNDDMEVRELLPIKPVDEDSIKTLGSLEKQKVQADSINKKVNTNNMYKRQLKNIDSTLLAKPLADLSGMKELQDRQTSLKTLSSEKQKIIKKIDALSDVCYVCKQPIDIGDSKKLAEKCRSEIKEFDLELSSIITSLQKLNKEKLYNKEIGKAIKEFEDLSNLIDNDLDTETINIEEVQNEISELSKKISAAEKELKQAQTKNQSIAAHNSKVEVQREQQKDYSSKLLVEMNKLEKLFDVTSQLEILKDAFSTNGLVSYKLEYLVKDLELVINEYLQELSRGKFQVTFILKGEKLNIEVLDAGKIITINEVSEGELSKINVSTLLAIRKLMQNLSNTKLNLLFLDEIMGVLDKHGKEDLINILLKEDSLNTFLVSHEYKHPLVPSLNIVKENNISRIDYE